MSKKSYEYNKKYAEKYLENYEEIKIRVPVGKRNEIKAHAARVGKSMNSYVLDLIEADMDKGE